MKNENTLEEKRKYMKRKQQNNTNVFSSIATLFRNPRTSSPQWKW